MLSPCHPEMGTNGTAAGLYPTFLIKDWTSLMISSKRAPEYGGSVESILLTPTMRFHTQSVSQKSVFTGLTILGNTSFELTSSGSDDQYTTIGLRGSSNHVLDEISVSG